MNKEQFIKYIENPNALSNESLAEFKQIIEDFPYFQTAQMLYAKNLHNIQDINYDSQIKIASTYTNNRERLFYLINNTDFVSTEIETSVEKIELIEEEIFKIENIEEKSEVENETPEKIETFEIIKEQPAIEMQEIVEVEQFINEIVYPSDEKIAEIEQNTEKPRSIADEILERVQRLKDIQNRTIIIEEKVEHELIQESKIEIKEEIIPTTKTEIATQIIVNEIIEEPIIEKLEFTLELVWNIDSLVQIQEIGLISEPIIEQIELSLELVWNVDSLIQLLVKEIEIIPEPIIEKIEFSQELVWNIDSLVQIQEIEKITETIIKKIELSLELVWNIDSLIQLLVKEIEKPIEILIEPINFAEIINISEFVWNIKLIVIEQVVEQINFLEILESSQFIVELSKKTINLTKPKVVKIRIRFEKIYNEIPMLWNVIEKYFVKEKSKINLSEILNSTPLHWEIIPMKLEEAEPKVEIIEEIKPEISEFSFNDWLKIVTKKEEPKPIVEKQVVRKKMNMDLIDKFIEKDPRIPQKIDPNYSLNEIIIQNSFDSEHFMTETLADIYVKQGHFDKAISVYQKLSLKNSENYIYFAVKIEEVQKLINQQKNI